MTNNVFIYNCDGKMVTSDNKTDMVKVRVCVCGYGNIKLSVLVGGCRGGATGMTQCFVNECSTASLYVINEYFVEFEPVLFPFLDRAGPTLDRTGLGSFFGPSPVRSRRF